MKTKLINIVMFVLCLGFLTWLTACGGGGDRVDDTTEPVCGNAVVEEGEECDVGVNGDASCSVSCTLVSVSSAICGNLLLESGEVCEDGNAVDGDGCSSVCQFESTSTVIDADGDGYTSTIDCNDADAAIHQNAADVVGDGIDQNCSDEDNYISQRDESIDNDGDGIPDITSTTSYNSSGKPTITYSDTNGDGTDDYILSFSYTDSGKTSQWQLTDMAGTLILQFVYVYDENDQIMSLAVGNSSASSTTTYDNSYDASNRLSSTLIDSGPADGTTDLCYSFGYDSNGNLHSLYSLIAPDCSVVSTVHNTIEYTDGRVSSVINSGASTPTQEIYNYNDSGLISQWLVYHSSDGSLSQSMTITYDSTVAGVTTDVSEGDWTFFVDSTISDSMYYRFYVPAITRVDKIIGSSTSTYTYELTFAED